MDPFNVRDDAAVWRALTSVQLDGMANASGNGLDMVLEEKGANLSAGQRQLVSIARALLRDSRILVQDEATASIDTQSDAIIQSVIRTDSAFANCTTISIAHRLHTIIDADRIAVMHNGLLIEHGAPAELAARAKSHFKDLLYDTVSRRAKSLQKFCVCVFAYTISHRFFRARLAI